MRVYSTIILIFFCFVSSFIFTSCSSTRLVPEGQYLLTKNDIFIESLSDWRKVKKNTENNDPLSARVLPLTKQKANKSVLKFNLRPMVKQSIPVFRFNLLVYNLIYDTKLNKIKRWIINNIAEPPVIYDSTQVKGSAEQMERFMRNKGYFECSVTYETIYKKNKVKKKKARVNYYVNSGPLYTIDTVIFPTGNNNIAVLINETKSSTLLQEGAPLDKDKLEDEKTRMVNNLLNQGYYKFNRNTIYFEADTTGKNHQATVFVKLDTPNDSIQLKKYYISRVYIYPDYEVKYELDTLGLKNEAYENDTFIYKKMSVREEVLEKVIFIEKGNEYTRRDYDLTLNRLADLGVFKFISVRYREVSDSLQCSIYLTPSKKNEIRTELEASNIEDNLGSALSLVFRNHNVARKATQVELNLHGGVEVPFVNTDSLLYNAGVSLDFTIPRFIFPLKHSKVSRLSNEKSRITLSTNILQQSKVFSLVNYNFTYGFDFKEPNVNKRHILNLAFVTLVNSFNVSPLFQARLDTDKILAQSFDDLLITGMNYNFISSNLDPAEKRSYRYFRGGAEVSGIFWYPAYKWILKGPVNSDGQYTVAGLPFSNYVRLDMDYRYNWLLGLNKKIVTRLYGGIGIPMWLPYIFDWRIGGNSSVLPYIKQFYAGGPSDIRAWRIRSLGPGSYNDTSQFNNSTGDIKLQANTEFRFPVFSVLRGAVFLDVGNVWDLKHDPNKPGADFEIGRFFKEIAVGTGLGARLDFTFLVIRVDWGIPLHDPALITNSEQWTYNRKDFLEWPWIKDNTVLNIAIGYPF